MRKRVAVYGVAFVITLIAVLVSCPSAFSQTITLKIAHTTAPSHPYTTMAQKLADQVKAKSNGSMNMTIHPSSQLGGERDLMEGMQVGTVDLVSCSLGVAASFVPELNVMNLPFLFRDARHYTEVANGPIGKKLLKAVEPKRLVGLGFYAPVFRVPQNNVRPINTPADFKGLRMRLMEVPLHMDTYKALGASPLPLPFGELYTALQLKTVDGNENAPATLYSERFYEVQKYVSLLPVFSNGAILLMSQATWNKLTPAQREIITSSVPDALAVGDRDYLAMDEKGLQVMKAAGLQINTPTDLTPFREAVKPIYAKYLEKMPDWVKEAFREIQK
ncbi:MAG TPA: TRAP transporter substrate-binding protein [Candidatus Methylomirabilis sp.]